MARSNRGQAVCHPTEPHRSNGLCQRCYGNAYYYKNHDRMKRYGRIYRQRAEADKPIRRREAKRRELDEPRKRRALGYNLKRYGLTVAEYEAMLEAQKGLCAICGRLPFKNRSLCVDHDHVTGTIRKLLCGFCNTAIAFADENPERLWAFIDYLEAHRVR